MQNVTVLVDFNNLLFRSFFVKEIGAHTTNPDYNLWRFMVYDAVYQLFIKIGNISEVIIAVDDINSWRKSYFPRYKESRKKQRDKSEDVNWDELFKNINDLVNELKHYMPFKVLRVPSAEADDIIAVLVSDYEGSYVISSNDEDFLQLSSESVKIWNPSKRLYIECTNTKNFIIEKCLTGQSKDDIFNIKTPSDWGQTAETIGKRKPGFGPKSAAKVMLGDYKKWLKDNNLEENFKRNRVLMDFDYIPETMRKRIRNMYENYSFPPPSNIYEFFKKYNFRSYLEDFTNVERRLMGLY